MIQSCIDIAIDSLLCGVVPNQCAHQYVSVDCAQREAAQISRSQFAKSIGVNLQTLQNWGQERTEPSRPAQALLKIVAADPKALEALNG